jgi:hypothetical protein
MRYRAMFAVALVLLIMLPVSAGAGFYDGNKLVELWRQNQAAERHDPNTSYFQSGLFNGYVTGVIDANPFLYDFPEGVTAGQCCAIVGRFLDAHPERWAESASQLVRDALKEAFPISNR